MEIKIRKAELKDIEDILKIAGLLYLDIPKFVWNTKEFIERQINAGNYYVALSDDKIVGIIGLRQRKKKMYIETIAINKESRSRGISKILIEFAKKYTREKNLNILFACSFYEYNVKDFYLSQSFSLLKKPGKYNGHEYYCFEMFVQ